MKNHINGKEEMVLHIPEPRNERGFKELSQRQEHQELTVFEIVDFTTSKAFAETKRKEGYIIRALPTKSVNFYCWEGC